MALIALVTLIDLVALVALVSPVALLAVLSCSFFSFSDPCNSIIEQFYYLAIASNELCELVSSGTYNSIILFFKANLSDIGI